MALDKIVDSEKLEIGLSDTAGLLGEFFAALCGDSSIPTFDWEIERVAVQGAGTTAAGFAKDIYEYLATHYSGSGGSGGSSGLAVKSGTVTLATTKSSITVDPQTTATPVFACIIADTITYDADGVNGGFYARLPKSATNRYGGSNVNTAEHFCALETRSTWNYINPQLMSGAGKVASTGKITFGVRSSSWPYFAGSYKWYAFYWEDYGND